VNRLLTLLIACAFAAAYAHAHRAAGYTFPVPWPDEGSFLWQAIALEKHGTLFAPELNPDRPVFWMPPGYAVVLGALGRLVGLSLGLARSLSACFVGGAFAVVLLLYRGERQQWAYALLAAAFFLAPPFVFAGNVARMEALLVLSVAAGMALLRGRPHLGAVLLLSGPLVHPNGLFFLAAGAVALAVLVRRCGTQLPAPRQLALLLVPAVFWLAYAAYVGVHWAEFRHDMGFQLAFKQPGLPVVGLRAADLRSDVVPLAAALLCLAGGWAMGRSGGRVVVLACLGGGAAVVNLISDGWNYAVFATLAAMCSSLAAVETGAALVARFSAGRELSGVATAAGVLALLVVHRLTGAIHLTASYPYGASLYSMSLQRGAVYVTPQELDAVQSVLDRLRPRGGQRVRVEFYPWGEALLFQHRTGSHVLFSQPTFSDTPPQVQIVHRSRFVPEPLQAAALLHLARDGAIDGSRVGDVLRGRGDDALAALTPIVARGGTERWYYRIAEPQAVELGR